MRYLKLQKNNEYKYCYKIADSLYQSDTLINGLDYLLQAHFQLSINSNSSNKTTKPPNKKPGSACKQLTYQHMTPIGEYTYPLQAWTNKIGNYEIKINSDHYHITNNTVTADIAKIDMTVLMGPVFILQLAKNMVFCLHASAFMIANTCFILMANSGTGKSTIARTIQQSQIGYRIADDIVPLKITNDQMTLLSNFPQLKLSQEQQFKGKNICQKTVLLFAQKSNIKTTINKIDGFITIKKLIEHSVATKLFSERELHNHLLFCHNTSELTQSYQLHYQHSKDSLNELLELLDDIA